MPDIIGIIGTAGSWVGGLASNALGHVLGRRLAALWAKFVPLGPNDRAIEALTARADAQDRKLRRMQACHQEMAQDIVRLQAQVDQMTVERSTGSYERGIPQIPPIQLRRLHGATATASQG